VGYGDQLIATGLARGAAARGKRIALGSQGKIRWDGTKSLEVFRRNPNLARPGCERDKDVEWIAYHKGLRGYNKQGDGKWIWNMDWKCVPGEMFFSDLELQQATRHGKDFVVIEPHVESWKPMAINKDWGFDKYQEVAGRLTNMGLQVVQFSYAKAGRPLRGVKVVATESFRHALSILRGAKLYVGAEGGLHHGAAAVGIPAVVLFGGWIPPSVTGYDTHENLSVGDNFCGSFSPCQHCRDAMASIGVDRVMSAIEVRLL